MNLILHQLKIDLRHFRWQILLLWIAFVVGPIVLLMGFRPESFSLVSALAMLWQIIGGLFLTVSVVQADPFVGTSAPWLTRPIRRCHLFWAKTIFLMMVILLPKLGFQSIGWLVRGYSTHLILCALGESMLYSVTVVLCAAVLGALTRNLARFFIALGIMVGGIFLWTATISVLVKIGVLQRSETVWTETASLNASKVVLAFGIMAVCALLAWVEQAYSRRWRFAVVLFTVGLFAFPLITTRWRGNFLKARLTGTPQLTLQIIRTNSPVEGQRIFSEMALRGVPEHQVAVAEDMGATLRIVGQGTHLSPGFHSGSSGRMRPGNSRQQYNYIKEIKGSFPADTLWFEQRYFSGIGAAFSDARLMARFGTQVPPGELRGNITLDLFEVKKVAEVPLAPASIKTIPGQQVEIKKISLTDNVILASLEESSVSLILDRNPVTSVGGRFSDTDPRNTYVLYQPAFGEAYLVDQRIVSHMGADAMTGEMRLSLQLAFRYSALRERLAGISAAEWLKGAKLCVFTPVYKGTARIAFKEENYSWQAEDFSPRPVENENGIKTIESAALPALPAEAQLERYLDAILLNAPEDLWPENVRKSIQSKLSAIGTNGLSALIKRLPLSERQENYLAFPVIRKLVNRDHLPDMLAALGRDPHLVEIFVEKHWEAEAQPMLLRMLNDHRRALPADALRIIAAVKDPATYPDLRWHFVRLKSNFYRVIPALESCPGFDLNGAVAEAWDRLNRERVGDLDIVVAAAKLGLPDALPSAVIQLEEVGNREWLQRTVPQLAAMTGYSGPGTNTIPWLSSNLEKLRFDSNLRRYVLQ